RALGSDQRPDAAQLVALQLEDELPFGEAALRVLDREPRSAVPDDDPSRAVVALGDYAFEVRVLERMIFDGDREPLLGGFERRTLRHGPRLEHGAELEPEVVV